MGESHENKHKPAVSIHQILVNTGLMLVPEGTYTATVGDVEYVCEVLPQYPDRLYCSGPALPPGIEVIVAVYPVGSNTPAYQSAFTVPEPQAAAQPPDNGGGDEEPGSTGPGDQPGGEGPPPPPPPPPGPIN